MSKSAWLVERVDGPDDIPFLSWVGSTGSLLQARFVTDWPPGEEDVDYMHERVKRDPLVLEDAQVAEQLALEGFPDAEVRPLVDHEIERLTAWRPFAVADRLLDGSTDITIHGARCDATLPLEAFPALERAEEPLPRLLVVAGPPPFQLLAVLRRDEHRWRLDAGAWPRPGQSLQTWLAGHHVRFCVSRKTPVPAQATLSGIRQRTDAEHLIIALQALAASCTLRVDREVPVRCEDALDCSLIGPVPVYLLPDAVTRNRADFKQLFAAQPPDDRAPRRTTSPSA